MIKVVGSRKIGHWIKLPPFVEIDGRDLVTIAHAEVKPADGDRSASK